MSSSEQSINLPQLVVLSLIGFLAIRWYFSSRAPNAPGAQGRGASSANSINPAHVEQVLQMFPQLDRRTVMWELQKSGGNVAAVTEKVLSGRNLERVRYALATIHMVIADHIIAASDIPATYACCSSIDHSTTSSQRTKVTPP